MERKPLLLPRLHLYWIRHATLEGAARDLAPLDKGTSVHLGTVDKRFARLAESRQFLKHMKCSHISEGDSL